MRTTIDLDESLLRRLRDTAHEQGISVRALLHRVIQRGLDAPSRGAEAAYAPPSLSLGEVREGIDLVAALRHAAELEDEEVAHELARRR